MKDKLIELLDELIYDLPKAELFADYLIDHGVNVCTSGEYLPREDVIRGVLKQMQASTHPKCMEEFLRNLNGVTVTDTNVFGKWIPVEERLPEKEGLYPYLVTDNRGNYSFSLFEPGKRTWIATWRERCITHWMPLPEPPKEVE